MLHKPAVLFLDEPTIDLDPVARHAVWKYLNQGIDDSRHGGSASHVHGGRDLGK
jgi:ABC-type uncharacterized transport system ATPase subunit